MRPSANLVPRFSGTRLFAILSWRSIYLYNVCPIDWTKSILTQIDNADLNVVICYSRNERETGPNLLSQRLLGLLPRTGASPTIPEAIAWCISAPALFPSLKWWMPYTFVTRFRRAYSSAVKIEPYFMSRLPCLVNMTQVRLTTSPWEMLRSRSTTSQASRINSG